LAEALSSYILIENMCSFCDRNLCVASTGLVVDPEEVCMPPRMQGRQSDHWVFSGLTLLLNGYMVLGFWQKYFGAGLLAAPLPSLTVHIHALLFVGWLVLFAAQIALIWVRRTTLHRKLGYVMGGWAAAMVILGPVTSALALRRPHSGVDAAVFAGDVTLMIVFGMLIGLGFKYRRNAPGTSA
jgi:hypothetical protein